MKIHPDNSTERVSGAHSVIAATGAPSREGPVRPYLRKALKQSPLALVILCFVAINVRWLWLYRYAQLLDIDEAGYIGISLRYYRGLVTGGVLGWIRAVESPSNQAPVTMALSSLSYLVFGPYVIVGFAVPLLAGAVTVAATYSLGKSFGSRHTGLISSLLVASCPVIVIYSRSYHFAMPATAVTTLAMLALLRSDRLANIRWASIFGICLGLMPLARTMTVAFLPGIVLGAAVYAVNAPAGRRRRLAVLAWSLLLAVATAATWLVPNAAYVFPYLTSFGYGARSVEYGTQIAFWSLEKWLSIVRMLISYLYAPHFLIILAGAVALLFAVARRFAQNGLRHVVYSIASSDLLPILITTASAIAALASSRNQGSAFVAPIVPIMIVVSVWSLHYVGTGKLGVALLTVGAVAVMSLAGASLIDLMSVRARPWTLNIPVLGVTTMTDGRGTIQLYEAAGGFGSSDESEPISPARAKAWIALSANTANKIVQTVGLNSVVAFGFRNRLYNVNTVSLQQLLGAGQQSDFRQVAPLVTGESVSGYRAWLTTGDAANASLLFLADGQRGEFPPAINAEYMKDAARQSGFALVEEWAMPDGQGVTMWKRTIHSASR